LEIIFINKERRSVLASGEVAMNGNCRIATHETGSQLERQDSHLVFHRLKSLFGCADLADDAGVRGEVAAAAFLQRERKFEIVAQNWRNPQDRREELDVVARDGEVLVFIEVKTRAAAARVTGYHAVNAKKKAVVRRAASAYLRALKTPPLTFRFDIVEVGHSADGALAIQHYENVPLFPKHFQP
jgi:putative endonuclease